MIINVIVFLLVLTVLAYPLGNYIVWTMSESCQGIRKSHDKIISKIIGNITKMNFKEYSTSLIYFSICGIILLYFIQNIQEVLPLNPFNQKNLTFDLSFNTAISFVSNTNWQSYSGETTLSYFTQMIGLTVQNFLSAAVGIAVLFVLFRGIINVQNNNLGNFWIDISRITFFVLIPISVLTSLILVSQGVVQSISKPVKIKMLDSVKNSNGDLVLEQTLHLGPVASQVAIKQLGTNGGGFYNTNSAHPFENPTPLSNFIELILILLIPASLCFSFGNMVKDKRQGISIYLAMTFLFLTFLFLAIYQDVSNPYLMEGKETRFGIFSSVFWSIATTAASNGSVNSMHDSYSALGGMFPMILMQLGEVVFGGVGSGLYGMLSFVILTVFVAGLMVGRTPEYLGKKIEPFEMKMVSIIILIPCVLVLVGTAIACIYNSDTNSVTNPGAHGFSQILYAYTSMGNNNGSAFAGFSANTPLHNIMGGIIMYISRFFLIIPILALASSLSEKKKIAITSGSLKTHTFTFFIILIAVILIVGALTFLPVLSLGPVAEYLQSIK